MPDATLLQFSQVNDAAAATTKKLQKQAILGAYFRSLQEDEDVRLATRYAGGYALAATEERVLSVGGALVTDAVLSILDVAPDTFWQTVRQSGEIGEALSKLWDAPVERDCKERGKPQIPVATDASPWETASTTPESRTDAKSATQASPLHLRDLSTAFDELAATGNQEAKRSILRALFERCSNPREATYLAKIIFGDLRTGVQEGVLLAAIAAAFARSIDDVRRAQLLVGDVGDVAVLAKHDRLNDARFTLFHPIQFMLATPQETSADAVATMNGRTFWAEDKLDGIRAQIHKSGDRLAIYTRTMDRIDASFPDIAEAIAKLPGEFLLDGEIVPYRDGCVLPFAHIQRRLGRKVLSDELIRANPCVFIAFDLLLRDGKLLMDEPLRVRKELLKKLAATPSPRTRGEGGGEGRVLEIEGSAVQAALVGVREDGPNPNPLPEYRERGPEAALVLTHFSEVKTTAQIDAAFEHARGCKNEGLVLKDPESRYAPGRRGKMWLKLKTHLPTLDCVVTAAEYGHGKRRNSLSDYTFAVWDRDPSDGEAKLVNVGKAYSGVTDEEIAQLTELFLKLSIDQRGHVHRVTPQVVMEIAFDQVQVSKRHASGYALRFPRIKRIRWDKTPADGDRLERVAEIYQSSHNFARGGELAAEVKPLKSERKRKATKLDPMQPTLFDLT